MPINFNLLQPMKFGGVVGQLPSAPVDNGLGSLAQGIAGFAGAVHHPTAPVNPSPMAGILPPFNPSQSTGFNPSTAQLMQPNNPGTALNRVQNNGSMSPIQSPSQVLSGINQNQQQAYSNDLNVLYQRPAFQTALAAQKQAFASGLTKSPVMTVVDFSLPSNQPRLWVVDTSKNKILDKTYVAHGSGSGTGLVPTNFSNEDGSHASMLGTFVTDQVYDGKHGESMRVRGMDKGVNDNAFARQVVVHGGDYVGPDKSGTSWGCFAVPQGDVVKLIGLTKGGTVIHAYAPDTQSLNRFTNTLTKQGSDNMHQILSASNLPKGSNPELGPVLAGISGVETGGEEGNPYNSISKASGNGDRAYGKYQIMGNNIPAWTREALGHPMTPRQFLNDPEAQDKVAQYRVNSLLQQGYKPQDIFSIWFSGRPMNKAGNAKDVYGTTVPEYVRKASSYYLQAKQRVGRVVALNQSQSNTNNGNNLQSIMNDVHNGNNNSGVLRVPFNNPEQPLPNYNPNQPRNIMDLSNNTG